MKPPRRLLVFVLLIVAVIVGLSDVSSAARRPRITSSSVDAVSETSATIQWSTNRRTRGSVSYGPGPDHGDTVTSTRYRTDHQVVLTGLDPDTTYDFEIRAVSSRGRVTTSTGTFDTAASPPPPPPPPPPPDDIDSFSCLESATTTTVDTTWAGRSIVGRIRPGHVGTGVGIDLRGTTISVHDLSDDALDASGDPVIDSRWGMVQIDSATDLCVAGGEVISPNPSDITWGESYDNADSDSYRLGTTRNNTAVDTAASVNPTVSGMYLFNLHDGPRMNGSSDWRLEHLWSDYTRDDCVENDEIASGVIYDTLFDGCYTGYSNRTTGEYDDDGELITGSGQVITFEKTLLRMEMMPGPYKACERAYLYFDVNREPYTADPCVEREVYGSGLLFKLVNKSKTPASDDPAFRLIDSVFVVDRYPMGDSRADFPSSIVECRNVVVIYLGGDVYPGRLPPQGCYTLLTGSEGESYWAQAVADWHARHPDVAPDRKDPASYGDLTFPRSPFD